MAAPQARTGSLASGFATGFATHSTPASGSARCLAGLAQHLRNEGVAALPGFAGPHAETVITLGISALAHDAAPDKPSAPERMRHTEFPMTARHGGCGRHEAALGRVPRPTHVQTGLVRTVVPHPSILPSAFASRFRSRQRRPGGAAPLATSPSANAARAAGRPCSRQDACTVDGCAGGSAKCDANAPALHARRHSNSSLNDTPDGTTRCTATCSESAAIMDVAPARPDAPRRSRRTR